MFFTHQDAERLMQALENTTQIRNRINSKKDCGAPAEIIELLENPVWMPELKRSIEEMTESVVGLTKLFDRLLVSQEAVIHPEVIKSKRKPGRPKKNP